MDIAMLWKKVAKNLPIQLKTKFYPVSENFSIMEGLFCIFRFRNQRSTCLVVIPQLWAKSWIWKSRINES